MKDEHIDHIRRVINSCENDDTLAQVQKWAGKIADLAGIPGLFDQRCEYVREGFAG